jgi:hypothetical protein
MMGMGEADQNASILRLWGLLQRILEKRTLMKCSIVSTYDFSVLMISNAASILIFSRVRLA